MTSTSPLVLRVMIGESKRLHDSSKRITYCSNKNDIAENQMQNFNFQVTEL
jgi:hypothetical protein